MSGFFHRFYLSSIAPPIVPKEQDALRFGILGASSIAPEAVILSARSHPEVIIYCVAARDRNRANLYAKKHNIPIVHDTYDDVINDPLVSCVYIALPNSHHYEWALRALKAGKHVLLEKPSTSNAIEAKKLFDHPLATTRDAPVLLEAFHYRFHPAWQKFLDLIHKDPSAAGPIKKAYSQSYMPKGFLPENDIRFIYPLAGGCLMDFAAYNISHIRQMLDDPHPKVQNVVFRTHAHSSGGTTTSSTVDEEGQNPGQVDEAVSASYISQTGARGYVVADLRSSGGWPLLPGSWTQHWPSVGWPKCTAELQEKQIYGHADKDGEIHYVQRTVTLYNHIFPHVYHCITVDDMHTIRRGLQEVRSWSERKNIKAYTWPKDSGICQGMEWWTTYRYQLEEFVNHIKARQGSGVWVSREDSISQMEVIDETYTKGNLKLRPTSEFDIDIKPE
nr:FunJ [Talaromyces coalescens]